MNNKCLISLLFATAFIGCQNEVSNPVNNSTDLLASFSIEGTMVAPARLLFTNRSQNARECRWDFGNGITSTVYQPGPVSYSNSGHYEMTLIVSDSASGRSDTALATLVITPGGPYLTYIYLHTIWWSNTEGRPWDGDSTGPDIFSELYTSDNRKLNTLSRFTNIAYASLPVRWYYNRILPDERSDFRLLILDYDSQLLQDTMAIFQFDQPNYTPTTTDSIHTSVLLRRFDRTFAELELVWQWF